jgi:hypothetical protein
MPFLQAVPVTPLARAHVGVSGIMPPVVVTPMGCACAHDTHVPVPRALPLVQTRLPSPSELMNAGLTTVPAMLPAMATPVPMGTFVSPACHAMPASTTAQTSAGYREARVAEQPRHQARMPLALGSPVRPMAPQVSTGTQPDEPMGAASDADDEAWAQGVFQDGSDDDRPRDRDRPDEDAAESPDLRSDDGNDENHNPNRPQPDPGARQKTSSTQTRQPREKHARKAFNPPGNLHTYIIGGTERRYGELRFASGYKRGPPKKKRTARKRRADDEEDTDGVLRCRTHARVPRAGGGCGAGDRRVRCRRRVERGHRRREDHLRAASTAPPPDANIGRTDTPVVCPSD